MSHFPRYAAADLALSVIFIWYITPQASQNVCHKLNNSSYNLSNLSLEINLVESDFIVSKQYECQQLKFKAESCGENPNPALR